MNFLIIQNKKMRQSIMSKQKYEKKKGQIYVYVKKDDTVNILVSESKMSVEKEYKKQTRHGRNSHIKRTVQMAWVQIYR